MRPLSVLASVVALAAMNLVPAVATAQTSPNAAAKKSQADKEAGKNADDVIKVAQAIGTVQDRGPPRRESGTPMTQTTEPAAPAQLQKGLKQRHLTMIAIGGVIGAGLFVGSGVVINQTGPGAFLTYFITGILIDNR